MTTPRKVLASIIALWCGIGCFLLCLQIVPHQLTDTEFVMLLCGFSIITNAVNAVLDRLFNA